MYSKLFNEESLEIEFVGAQYLKVTYEKVSNAIYFNVQTKS